MYFVKKIGYIAIAYWGFQFYKKVYQRIYKVFFTPDCNIDLKKMGKWGMVTGCTRGIGRAYAEALAQRQICIILVDISSNNLDKFAEFIESTYGVETRIIELNASNKLWEYKEIEDKLIDLEIGVIINNFCAPTHFHPEYFLDSPENKQIYDDIILFNITIPTNICRILLPQMVEREKGIIVNVASTYAVIPSPLMTVFAASKAYILKFSKDLAVEYRKNGIIIQCVCPASISSKVPGTISCEWVTPSPKRYVESAIATIGKDNVTTGYFSHTLLIGLFKFMYQISSTTLIGCIVTFMERHRKQKFHEFSNN